MHWAWAGPIVSQVPVTLYHSHSNSGWGWSGPRVLQYSMAAVKRQDTPLHWAASSGDLEEVRKLLEAGSHHVNCVDRDGWTPLHWAAVKGHLGVVRMLLSEFGADVNVHTAGVSTPFSLAMLGDAEEVALALINEFNCDTSEGTPYIHKACRKGWSNLVQALVRKHGVNILNCSSYPGDTPLHSIVATECKHDILFTLIKEFGSSMEDDTGRSVLYIACEVGNLNLVRTLILDYKADVTARDNCRNTPLHVAAIYGREDIVLALINEFSCDVTTKGLFGKSLLHSACSSGAAGSLVKLISKHVSPWVTDDNGDTPLHYCSYWGNLEGVLALLEFNPPIMIRNDQGKTPRDVSFYISVSLCLDGYMRNNKGIIYSHYEVVQKHAKSKYSRAEPITRAFVVGDPGAGKSSLVEALKREGFVDSFFRVSESSVPPHTAGIVPSIHTSKRFGRVLFYDFAGDREYYSSHAAILENLASSRKGDNVFILVVDLRGEMDKIKKTFHYWLSFIQHQQFQRKPHLVLVCSHLDLLSEDVIQSKRQELKLFCDGINSDAFPTSAFFMLDCCKPRSKQIAEIQALINRMNNESPRFKLSLQASILLGLLEKDFSNVPACSIQVLLSHIEETGIQLPTEAQSLHPILLELHDLGLLFIIYGSNGESSSVVLDMSRLTNKLHQSLFSRTSLRERYEKEGLSFPFSTGIIPRSILAKILPENITVECLVQLQYCQEISHAEAHVFPSLKVSDSTDKSFLFFPALCSADKSEVEWVTPPELSYGIGWLAQCTDPFDYLSPRFHHVLMLRLVFKFTLSAHPPADQVLSDSADLGYFQRRCTVWKTGVHWLMEEGVECMVELVNANREVVVLTRSTKQRAGNCANVFNDVVSCVMEAKAEFCHSVRLEFFILDSTSEADYLSANNLFSMKDVERVLTSAEGRAEVIVSDLGKRQMERSKLLCLLNFTLWSSLFPMDFKSVLHYIKDIVKELYMLGLYLGIPKSTLDALEADNRTDVCKMRRELVKVWLSSSIL